MENFGIALSVPVSAVAGIVYALIFEKVARRWQFLLSPLLWISSLILTLLAIEAIGALTVGAVELRKEIGPSYELLHGILFFLALPSLVNVMRLQKRIPFLAKLYVISGACAIAGLAVVLLNFGVSEALFGIDGMSGPYARPR